MDELDMQDFKGGRFRMAAKGRAGHRYNGDGYSTLRTKPGVGSKGSDDYNDTLRPGPGEGMFPPRLR